MDDEPDMVLTVNMIREGKKVRYAQLSYEVGSWEWNEICKILSGAESRSVENPADDGEKQPAEEGKKNG